jgi:Xaa-Pro aminopeptidase
LFEEVKRMLDGFNGWRFFHHLGHGTGLSPHEAPRLNPHWDDVFQSGDLFTVEPGLYHEELRGGVRLEQNYWLTAEGLTRLSSFPLGV